VALAFETQQGAAGVGFKKIVQSFDGHHGLFLLSGKHNYFKISRFQ
jgi:hypothetical protein